MDKKLCFGKSNFDDLMIEMLAPNHSSVIREIEIFPLFSTPKEPLASFNLIVYDIICKIHDMTPDIMVDTTHRHDNSQTH